MIVQEQALTNGVTGRNAIGRWGRLHLDYLMKSKRERYDRLLSDGELHGHLAGVDRQRREWRK